VDFEELSVLDLFSGTGSISLEFASRGAKDIVSVDLSFRCTDFLKTCSATMGFRNIYPVKANVFNYLKSVRRQFDLIFADPPYDMKEVESLPDLIFERGLLKPGGWLIIEHDESHHFQEFLRFEEERKYGKVHFSFLRISGQES
jgi:16S rRNA (guanine(966)-N(2))-methyltransferase RsmD